MKLESQKGMRCIASAALIITGTFLPHGMVWGWGDDSNSSATPVKSTAAFVSQEKATQKTTDVKQTFVSKAYPAPHIIKVSTSSASSKEEKNSKPASKKTKLVEKEEPAKATEKKSSSDQAASENKNSEQTGMEENIYDDETAEDSELLEEEKPYINEPLPRFILSPEQQPHYEDFKTVQPVGREIVNVKEPQARKGILEGEGMPRIHPHLALLYVYDDNFLTRENNPVGDFIFDTAPGVSMEIGKRDIENPDYNRIYASYTAHFIRFLDEEVNNSNDQEADMIVRYNFSKTTLGLQQKVETRSESTVDIGTRAQRDIYGTILSGKHEFTEKTYAELTGTQVVTNYTTSTLSDNTEWMTNLLVNYRVTPKVVLGAGPKIGWVDVEGTPNQFYQQAITRMLWQATAKVAMNLMGGVEWRQFQDSSVGGVGDSDHAVYELGVNWDPFDGTKTGLRTYRRNEVSAGVGENFIAHGVEASIRQRFFQRYYLALVGGYENLDYYSTSPFVATSREDSFYSIGPSLTCALSDWGTVGIFYQRRRNDSNQPTLTFTDNIYGIEANFRY